MPLERSSNNQSLKRGLRPQSANTRSGHRRMFSPTSNKAQRNVVPLQFGTQINSMQVTPKQNNSVSSINARRREARQNQNQVFNVDITMNITGNVNFFMPQDDNLQMHDTRQLQAAVKQRQRPKSGVVNSGQSMHKSRFNSSKHMRKASAKKAHVKRLSIETGQNNGPQSKKRLETAEDLVLTYTHQLRNSQHGVTEVQNRQLSRQMRPNSAFTHANAMRGSQLMQHVNMNSSGTLFQDQMSGMFTVGKERSQSPKQRNMAINNETIFKKNPQAEVFQNYFASNLNQSILGGNVQQQQQIYQENKIFEDIYLYNKKIGSSCVNVENEVQEKEQTLLPDQVQALYIAKQRDLRLPETDEQRNRFIKFCMSHCINGKAVFTEMLLQVNFAAVFNSIFLENPTQRITHLNLSHNHLGDQGAILLIQAVKHSKVIIYLNLVSNDIGPSGMQCFFDELVHNESLLEFDIGTDEGINRNRISPRNYMAIQRFIFANKFCSIWGLKGVTMDQEGVATILRCLEKVSAGHQEICDDIMKNKDFDIIELENTYTKPKGDNTALEMLLKSKRKYRKEPELPTVARLTLQSLNLQSNEFNFQVSKHYELFKKAIVFSDLRELDLSFNKLGDEGMKVISGILEVRSRLEKLNLTQCGIRLDKQSGQQLLFHLAKNHSLHHIVLDKNNLYMARPTVFKDIFFSNKSLKSISMNHCMIGRLGAIFIAEGLGSSKALTYLSLNSNNIQDIGIEKFSNSLKYENFQIEHLFLQCNNISDKGGMVFARAMIGNTSFKTIDLRNNELSMKTANLIKPAILSNWRLVKVHLEENVIKIRVLQAIQALCAKNQAYNEKWDLRTLKKDVRTERKSTAITWSTPQEMKEVKEKLQGIPPKDHAMHLIRLQMEECKTQELFYKQKAQKFEAQLLQEQMTEHTDLETLEQRGKELRKVVNAKKELVRENDNTRNEKKKVFEYEEGMLHDLMQKSEAEQQGIKQQIRQVQLKIKQTKAINKQQFDALMKEVQAAESTLRTYKMIHDSKLDDTKRIKKELEEQSVAHDKEQAQESQVTKQNKKKANKQK